MSLFEPDRYFARLSAIDIQHDILLQGFDYVLLDVDNTVLTRDDRSVPYDVLEWISKAKRCGVMLCLLSNNFHAEVQEVAQMLDIPLIQKALKPLPFGFLRARRYFEASFSEMLVIGDQISTDIVGAHLVGIKAYLVCPLVEADLPHMRLVRVFEAGVLKEVQPEGVASNISERS